MVFSIWFLSNGGELLYVPCRASSTLCRRLGKPSTKFRHLFLCDVRPKGYQVNQLLVDQQSDVLMEVDMGTIRPFPLDMHILKAQIREICPKFRRPP